MEEILRFDKKLARGRVRLASPADQRVPVRVGGLDRYPVACQVPGCLRQIGWRECDPVSDDPAPTPYWFVYHGHVCGRCSQPASRARLAAFLARADVAKDRAYRVAKGDIFTFLALRRAALSGDFALTSRATKEQAALALASEARACYERMPSRWRALADQAVKGHDPLPTIRRWNVAHEAECLAVYAALARDAA